MNQRITLEVCVASVEDAVAAHSGGADRLELNVALELGGLTPSIGLLQEVKQIVGSPVITMIRPRSAGFRYSSMERRWMLRDIEEMLSHGANGIAIGALLPDGSVDFKFLNELTRLTARREVVFHRAFDLIENQDAAIERLIQCGITRVLTSGAKSAAMLGCERIRRLREVAADRIEILPGAGVTPENVVDLIRETGCNQVHGSFGILKEDPAGSIASGSYPATCRDRVARTREAIDTMSEAQPSPGTDHPSR